ncbi:hypothetical protein ABWK24_04985 [Priestia megaterium]|uniref:hypothetical protein n=1 Tax=Priestia megaterium TaxID=1404 RepID=UPI003390C8B1
MINHSLENKFKFLVNNNLKENEFRLYFLHGARDDKYVGTSHLYEHLFVQHILDKYEDDLLNVNGATNRDLIKVSISGNLDCLCRIIDDLIKRKTLDFEVQDNPYQLQKEIIEQELSIHKNNPQSRIQQLMYEKGKDNDLAKPLYSKDFPSLEEVQELVDKLKISELTLVVPPNLMKYIKEEYSIAKKSEDIFQDNNNYFEVVKESLYRVEDTLLANENILIGIQHGLISIKELEDYSDFYYIRIVTNIINNRLKSLRNLGVYFNLCFPNYHRREVSISIMFSCKANQENLIFRRISEIISTPLSQEEIFQKHHEEETEISVQKNEIKEQIAVLYSNEDMISKQTADKDPERILFIQDLILKNLKKTIIINHN